MMTSLLFSAFAASTSAVTVLSSALTAPTVSYTHLYFPVFAKQKKIEQDTFKYADAITGLSGAYLNIFNDL